jgi:NAD(P)H-dependent FMN reductase
MMETRPLYIPVILGTTRMGRMSAHVARLLTEEVSKQAGVETDLIDIAGLPLPIPFARAVKYVDSKSAAFTASCALGPTFFQISRPPS